jgi:hypothetical protein
VSETTVKRFICYRFRRTDKEMGQVYQYCWICQEINVFSMFELSHVLRFISICGLFTDSPAYIRNAYQKILTVFELQYI